MSFNICSACRRHVKSADECPFCAKAGRSSLRVGALLALAATTLVACSKDVEPASPGPTANATEAAQTPEAAKPEAPKQDPVADATATSTPAAPTSAPTTAPTTPTSAPTSVASAKPKPPIIAPVPERPVMARYGVAPNFRE